MTGYSIFVRPDLLQVFWTGMQAGEFITDAVLPIETSRRTGRRVLLDAGGVRPRGAVISKVDVCLSRSVRRSLYCELKASRCVRSQQ